MAVITEKMVEDCVLIGGLVGVQIIYAGNSVMLSYLMSSGMNSLSLIIFSAFATFLVLSPFAIFYERSFWPKRITLKLSIQLLFISILGVTLFQSLFLKGIELTSPAVATAMPNLAPGLIFIIAWTFRLEKVKMRCIYSQIKIAGTLLCVVGALMMSMLHSTASQQPEPEVTNSATTAFDKEKIIGCVYLLGAVFTLSSNIVLQATTLGEFPAPISLCAVTSLIGGMTTLCVEWVQTYELQSGWGMASVRTLLGISLLGGTVNGACFSFNGWAMKKKGPVLVSVFSPIATVLSVVISVITLGDSISFGSLAGMCLMFTGLYFVLWAKGKEGLAAEDNLESGFEGRKPLLS